MKNIQEAVRAMSDQAAESQGVSTLGELRAALKMVPAGMPVVIDTGNAPASLASYRGYYERLAIGTARHRDDYTTEAHRHAAHPVYDPHPNISHVTIAAPVTAAEVVKALDAADGLGFGGYKGGTYVMGSSTWLHVAEYGDCGRSVVGVRVEDGKVIIESAEDEW